MAWEDASVQWQAGCEMTEKDKEREYLKIKPNAYAILVNTKIVCIMLHNNSSIPS